MSANPSKPSDTTSSQPSTQASQDKDAARPAPTPAELQKALKTDTGVPDEVIASATTGA